MTVAVTDVWHTAADWVVPPLAAALTAMTGFYFGRARRKAETVNITAEASQTAVHSLVETLTVLRAEVELLKREVAELKTTNHQLRQENDELRQSLTQLRRIMEGADHYRGYYEDRPPWFTGPGGEQEET